MAEGFRPSGQDDLAPAGRIGRIQANLEAIRVLRVIQDEQRPATPGEQAILARWSGWGAVPQIFDQRKDEFADYRQQLRALLTEDEYAAARRTTLNAHYTDAAIARTVWDAVSDLGFSGGTVLEPGCGSGNFIGFAPPSTRMLGIELDPVTAAVAAALYPDAEIRPESFADTRVQPGGFDVAIGNVPFSNAILTDRRHNPGRHSLHNHFIIKSLDAVRPGGLVAVLTSRYTMDAVSDGARRSIADRADLVTAIRLPRGAHQRAAGTDAVTDLMILRRREDGRPPAGAGWMQAVPAEFEGGTARVNEYFTSRPENVLGDLIVGSGQFSGEELTVRPRDLARVPEDLAGRLAAAVADAHEAGLAMSPRRPGRAAANIQAGNGQVSLRFPARDASRFEGTITAHGDGTFTVLRNGEAEPWPCPDSQAGELRALLRLRDTVCEVLASQDSPELARLQARLNREYDAYAAAYGALNRVSWRRTGRTDENGNETWARQAPAQGKFRQDPYAATVYALEDFDPETGIASKSQIFTERVIKDRQPAESAESPADAIAICMDADGQVRLERATALLGSPSPEHAREQLGELVYDEPGTGVLVPAAEYLSGKVRAKLGEAEKAAETDPRFGVNVAALRKVLPADLGPGEIDARLGASWIPPELVQQGLQEILEDPTLTAVKGHGTTWQVKGNTHSIAARDVYGTADQDAVSLAQHVLEQRPIKVRYSLDDLTPAEKQQLSSAKGKDDMAAFMRARAASATIAARAKADELSDRFAEWLWENPQRSAALVRLYNDKFNSLVLRSYDSARPRLPGLAEWFKPHPHQYAAVARIINEPAALLAHEVGAGKTAEMAMGCMELRRLDLASKPAIVVPNHMLEQFQREFLQLYPQARVLAAGMKDLQKDRRHAFVARIATGSWDAVIMSRSVFERIPMSAPEQERYIKAKLADYDEWLEKAAAESEDPRMVKRMEKQRLSYEERLRRKLSRTKDAGISWEQTGIDYLMIDEAHGYKNRDTRSNSPSLDIDGSARAADLEMKLDCLRRANGRRIVTFATATPIANSMTEAYVMLSYLRPDLLKDAGIEDFDGWAGTFASPVSDVEVAPEGGIRVKERIARFRNLPELLLMWRVVADVKTGEDLAQYLRVPELAGGKPEVVTIPPSQELGRFMGSLASRADDVRSGKVPPKEDNMLKISSDGRAAALDLRLAGWDAPAEDGKLDVAARRIAQIYRDHRDTAYLDRDGNPEPVTGSLQIVFCELGTPTGSGKFGAYEYLKAQLAGQGVPGSQIRFMHEAKNDKEKADLFAAARAGKVSVLIGTTELMGVGTNVQKRAVALHHLDCPWRPADVAQREGRILRQGNQASTVQILRYVTEGSFDAYMWQTVTRKAKFIAQVMHGRLDSREIEDIGGSEALSYSEVTALATGDMRILAKARADAEVQRLSKLETSWRRARSHLQTRIADGQRTIPRLEDKAARLEAAISRRTEMKGDAFHCTLNGTPISKRTDAADALRASLGEIHRTTSGRSRQQTEEASPWPLGTFGGFTLEAKGGMDRFGSYADLRFPDIPTGAVRVRPADPDLGIVTKLENKLAGLDTSLTETRQDLADTQDEVKRARETLGAPFTKTEELAAAREEADQLAAELGGQRPPAQAEPDAHETPVADAAMEAGDEDDEAASGRDDTWEADNFDADEDANPLDDAAAGQASGDWDDEPGDQAAGEDDDTITPADEPADDLAPRDNGNPEQQPADSPAADDAGSPAHSEAAAPDTAPAAAGTQDPALQALLAATEVVETHRPWGGTLRPERLIYQGGTELAVRRRNADGDETVPATAIGSTPSQRYGGHLQVVRWEDGTYGLAHPARISPRDVDPYAGLSDRNRARWEIFDRAESYGESIAYLPARLIQAGDTLQLQPGTRKRPADLAEVRSASGSSIDPDNDSIHFTLPGHKHGLNAPSDRKLAVRVPDDHPSLAATIEAITGERPGRDQAGDSREPASSQPDASSAPAPAPAPAQAIRRPTAEQQAIIDACVSGQNLVIEAGADTGKTSTLRMAAAAMTGRTGLYVAYNRAIAAEARGSFPSNVTCATAHSLAFRAVGRPYAHRLPPKSRRLPAQEVASLLGLREPLQLGDGVTLTPAQLAGIVMSTVSKYCQSADDRITAAHIPQVNGLTSEDRRNVTSIVLPLAVTAWAEDLTRTDGRLPFQPDHYLKMWQLTQPDLNADFVLFDEAQDANPVIAAIIQGQRNAQKIAVGDSCQAIYGWRGAVDALATWPADQRLYLSQSFRFGPQVAGEANKWLENLGAPLRLKGTPAISSTIGPLTAPDAVLCRTNAEAVSQALNWLEKGSRVALVGGGDDIKRLAEAAQELQQRGYTNHPELAGFTGWDAVQRYVREDDSGADLATFVRLIDNHGPAAVIRTVDQLSREEDADVTISTAHKAKGREWDRVLIADDFREPKANEETGGPGVIPRPDAMLAYVAVTRARKQLDRKGLEWIDRYADDAPQGKEPSNADRPAPEQTVATVPGRDAPDAHGQADTPATPSRTAAEKPASSAGTASSADDAAVNVPRIRIEHDDDGSRVYNTDKSDSAVKEALKDQGFKWSRRQGFWYLNRSWKQDTRDARVRGLETALDNLNVPHERARAEQEAPASTATAPPESPSDRAPEPSSDTPDIHRQPSQPETAPGPSEAKTPTDASNVPPISDDSQPAPPAENLGQGFEQELLFGTPPAKTAGKERPSATGQPKQASPSADGSGTNKKAKPAKDRETEPEAAAAPSVPAQTPAEPPAPEPSPEQPAEPETPAETSPAAEPSAASPATPDAPVQEPRTVVALASLADVPVDPRPYAGSRAQAESGSMWIERDYQAWRRTHEQAGETGLPPEHPRVIQLTRAWRAVQAKGLADGPGPSAIRYHTVAHAAIALASVVDPASGSAEIDALNLLATHARKHSVRLRATAEHLFSQSNKAGRYANGRADAERGSKIIESDYRAWAHTGVPTEAARDPLLWQHARRAELAWHAIRRAGLADGPAPAAARYRELADATKALADGFTVTLPSYSLNHLLELAEHADKHATRLHATAQPRRTPARTSQNHRLDDRGPTQPSNGYRDLPDHLATVTEQARASQPVAHRHEDSDDNQAARRHAALHRESTTRGNSRS